MITIIVDCNNDTIVIDDNVSSPIKFKLTKTSPNELLKILYEVINCINKDDIELIQIDEDSKITVGEW